MQPRCFEEGPLCEGTEQGEEHKAPAGQHKAGRSTRVREASIINDLSQPGSFLIKFC